MAVYGRIEEVSETIQSNDIENRLDRNLESHVEKEEQVAFPFSDSSLEYGCNVFSVVIPLLLDMVSPSQAQDLYIEGGLGIREDSSTVAIMLVTVLFITCYFTSPKEAFFCLGRMASPLRRRLFPLFFN